MEKEIVNKVANSSLITIDLDEWALSDVLTIDISHYLFQDLVLKEKDFREALKSTDWRIYQNKKVALYCSTDAIIPTWAFMLITIYLSPYSEQITFGSKEKLIEESLIEKINNLPLSEYIEKRVVIKGCSKHKIPTTAYVKLTAKLQPVVKSIMYGEPCSTVPLFKK